MPLHTTSIDGPLSYSFDREIALEEFGTSELDVVLDRVMNYSMRGAVKQIHHVTVYARRMFDNLYKDVLSVKERTQKLKNRVNAVQDIMEPLSSRALGSRRFTMTDAIHARANKSHFLFSRDTLPEPLQEQYASISRGPDFTVFDRGDDTVISSRMVLKYSNPDYFFEQWIEDEILRQKAKQERVRKKRLMKISKRSKRKPKDDTMSKLQRVRKQNMEEENQDFEFGVSMKRIVERKAPASAFDPLQELHVGKKMQPKVIPKPPSWIQHKKAEAAEPVIDESGSESQESEESAASTPRSSRVRKTDLDAVGRSIDYGAIPDMMSEIKRGRKLKRVSSIPRPPKEEKGEAFGQIMQLLDRRRFIDDDSDDAQNETDNSEWDSE